MKKVTFTLTEDQAAAICAFIECFDCYTVGVWPKIEEAMRDEYGIENPETALDEARQVLEADT